MSGRPPAAALALAALALLASPATGAGERQPAERACGGVQEMGPKRDVGPGRAPLAIGDSAMLLALPDLAKRGFRANARGCRQYPEALALMRKVRREGKLPRLVVVSIGGNGPVRKAHIHEALAIVGRKRTLALVTPLELGGIDGSDADLVRREARRHDKRIRLLDWARHSRGHPGWFQPDGIHFTFAGAEAFARFLARALPGRDRDAR